VHRDSAGRYYGAMDRHADEVAALRRAVLETPGAADSVTREAAFGGVAVPGPWDAYLNKVREASHRITDADVEALIAAGCSEDAVFEMTLAAALGAAARRLDAGLRAVQAAEAG
jgi:hypothetical protein